MQLFKKALCAGAIATVLASNLQAGEIVFDNWITNYANSGNYILTVDDNTAGHFNYTLTIDPWNAEALGLFIDLGNYDFAGNPISDPSLIDISDVNPFGEVDLYAYDVSSPDCGAACSLATLTPQVQTELDKYDSEWEMTFRLGDSGFDNIQTFSFSTLDFGLTLADFTTVAVRSNQFCHGDDLLPTDLRRCYFGNKAYSTQPSGGPNVSEPGTLALFSLALAGAGFIQRRKNKQ